MYSFNQSFCVVIIFISFNACTKFAKYNLPSSSEFCICLLTIVSDIKIVLEHMIKVVINMVLYKI